MNHNGFVSMYSGPPTTLLQMYSNSTQLRLGFQGGVIDWNYAPADVTLPDIDPMGEMQSVVTPVTEWSCIEFHLDQTTGDIEFWFQAQESSTKPASKVSATTGRRRRGSATTGTVGGRRR